jgi:iron complex outermembrane recepter protein
MAYRSATRGAKSGGINVAILAAGIDPPLRPEMANAIELGWKSQWLGQTLQFNLATFWMDIDDYQATLRDRVRNVNYLTNAGTVRSRGVEIETLYRPSARLSLSLAAGWNEATYTSFTDAPCPTETVNPTSCDFTGHRVVGAPPWTATGMVNFEHPLDSAGHSFFASADYTHTAPYKLDLSDYTRVDAYGLANLQFGIQAPDDRWRVWLWTRNLLDEEYFGSLMTAGAFSSGAVIGVVGDPVTFGLSIRGRL